MFCTANCSMCSTDTSSIVALLQSQRKPVIFLHWYHHTTVLLFTWFAEYWRFSMAVIFILVNAFVHTVMYFYYFMSGLHYRFPDFVPLTITILQITQMFVGIGTNLYWANLFYQGYRYVVSTTIYYWLDWLL
jgi:elongation of very long chain fatty acids protein 6